VLDRRIEHNVRAESRVCFPATYHLQRTTATYDLQPTSRHVLGPKPLFGQRLTILAAGSDNRVWGQPLEAPGYGGRSKLSRERGLANPA